VLDLTKQTKLDSYFKKKSQSKRDAGDAYVLIDPSILISDESESAEGMSEDEKRDTENDVKAEQDWKRSALESQRHDCQGFVYREPSPTAAPRPKAQRREERETERYPHNERIRADIDNDPILCSDDEDEKHVVKAHWRGGEARRKVAGDAKTRITVDDSDSRSEDEYTRFGQFAMKGRKTGARGWNALPTSPKKTSPSKAEMERERVRRRERELERDRLCGDSPRDSEVEIVTPSKVKTKEENDAPIKTLSQLDLSCLLSQPGMSFFGGFCWKGLFLVLAFLIGFGEYVFGFGIDFVLFSFFIFHIFFLSLSLFDFISFSFSFSFFFFFLDLISVFFLELSFWFWFWFWFWFSF
jgi:hypothetical protein